MAQDKLTAEEIAAQEAETTPTKTTLTTKKEVTVKVLVLETHTAWIAMKPYSVVKDSTVQLPEDVAAILSHSNIVRKV